MVLSTDEVTDILNSGVQHKIAKARKRADHLNMHVTGKGLKNYLEDLDDYENTAQKLLREKLAKSNKSTFSFILRPMDKIFTAKGGSINYNLSSSTVQAIKSQISGIVDGLDIKSYLKKVVKKHYVIDPNGVLFCDLNKKGMIETHCIPTKDIFWYKTSGNKVEAIIFEGHSKEEKKPGFFINENFDLKDEDYQNAVNQVVNSTKEKFYRVIDSKSDRVFKKTDNVVEELEGETVPNYFGFVPAMIIGDEKDYDEDIFESPISDLVDDADILLRRLSVLNVHELAHLYPKYWSIPQACTRCEGEGKVDIITDKTADPPIVDSRICPSCGGSGQKQRSNASDELIIELDDEGKPITDKPFGYGSPDLQTATFYDKVIKDQREEMFRAMWGTTYETGGKRETATGRWLDAEPVADRLKDMSFTFSNLHKFLLDCYVGVILQRPRYESSVIYGTRYNFDGPDSILDKFLEISRENIGDVAKMDLQMRYFESQYKDDPIELLKRKKLIRIEPMPTLSVDRVVSSTGIPDTIKKQKIYFAEWVSQIPTEKLVLLDTESLKNEFLNFINQKQDVKGEII